MDRRLRRMLAASVLPFILWATPAAAYHGKGLHWRGAGVRRVVVVDKTGSAFWQQRVANAVAAWNATRAGVTLVHQRGSGGCSTGGGTIQVCLGNSSYAAWRYDPPTRHFHGAMIVLNSASGRWGDALACHELGHALGLGHRNSNETSSCMTSSVYTWQTRPDSVDAAALGNQHRHNDA